MWKLLICLSALPLAAADFRAGVAQLKITPEKPIQLSGYMSRTRPSEGVAGELWAKAIAIEDAKGNRVVIVTTDLLGLPRSITDPVAARTGLDRAQLVFNSSGTHSGPLLQGDLTARYGLSPDEARRVQEYSVKLADDLVAVIGAALGDLKPAVLSYAEGAAVPVLKIASPEGALRAVLFGYALQNSTLGGESYEISGDYAGFAQTEIERAHSGVAALFMQLCGAGTDPNPRGTPALARQHGRTLAAEVTRVLASRMRLLRGPIRGAFQIVEPGSGLRTRQEAVHRIPYPVQAVRFGKSLTLVALGGEVPVDYTRRIKREFRADREPIVVAGNSNDVAGPVDEQLQENIFTGVRSVMKRVGR